MAEQSLSLSQHYHERTKYDPQTIAQRSRPLNFAEQPSPYKDYKLGAFLDLKPYLEKSLEDPSPLARLSRLLYFSYGITGVIPYPGQPFYMRAAPSAGGLYPAELYLIAREDAAIAPGLYNYQVKTHSLCHFWVDQVWPTLEAACLWHPALRATPLALIVTAVFYRSAWRYEDRAYRRVCLDSGHLLGNLELAASLNHYRVHLMGGFVDAALNQLLYLDGQQEGALVAIALADLLEVDQNLPSIPTALPSPTETQYASIPDGELLNRCHQASSIPVNGEISYQSPPVGVARQDKYNFPFCQKVSTQANAVQWGKNGLASTLQQRRSTRQYTGEGFRMADLLSILDFAYYPSHYLDQGFDPTPDFFDLSLIETFIAVSDIDDLEAGCYYYAVHAQELRQVRFKPLRAEIHYLCLQQDLGQDAAAVVFHTADLQTALERYGDRAYRYLHLDAGHLGQRLNLAAIRLGLGVSGIGGFFDDQVNEALGIPTAEAVLYITTLGQPVPPPPSLP